MNESSQSDEISLRELYLVFKRGLLLIVAVAAVAGLLAFAVMSFRPNTYEAESTVLINPSPVRAQGPGNLSFNLANGIAYEAYQTLAGSGPVLDAAASRVPQANISANELRQRGRLVRLVAPLRDQVAPLSVTHVVQHTDPALAAALADAWAESTLEAVRSALLADLKLVGAATTAELARLEAELTAVEARWRAFQEQDESDQLTALLSGTSSQLAEGKAKLTMLERQIAAAQAKQALLRDRLGGLGPVTREVLAQLAITEAHQAGLPLLRTQLEALALETPTQFYDRTVAILDLTEYHRAEVALAGSLAEREVVLAQYQHLQDYAAELRERSAALTEQRNRLERELSRARSAHSDIVAVQSIITSVTELALANTRLFNQASIPIEAVGPSRLFITALAVVIAGLLAVVFVFLREAVSSRPAPFAPKGVQAEAP